MTELSWPIDSVKPHYNGEWVVTLKRGPHYYATAAELAAAGIPAEPYPAPTVTITVTVGERSEEVELTERNIEWCLHRAVGRSETTAGKVGAALRRLGVQ